MAMGNKTAEEKEELLMKVEELIMQRVDRPYEISKILGIAKDTADSYKNIALRRIRNRSQKFNNLDKILKRELADLDYMEKKCWHTFRSDNNPNAKNGAMNTINKIKERRAKLLGFDTENVNQGKSKTLEDLLQDDENKSRVDTRVIQNPKQADKESKVQPEQSSDKI